MNDHRILSDRLKPLNLSSFQATPTHGSIQYVLNPQIVGRIHFMVSRNYAGVGMFNYLQYFQKSINEVNM